jgi:hypothetical protein
MPPSMFLFDMSVVYHNHLIVPVLLIGGSCAYQTKVIEPSDGHFLTLDENVYYEVKLALKEGKKSLKRYLAESSIEIYD